MTQTEAPLQQRFIEKLLRVGVGATPQSLLIALSGGVDSTVLLHLLRFHCEHLQLTLSAGHLDHRMRPSSAADANWVRGLCAAWEVPVTIGASDVVLRTEQEAREARYAFLRQTAARAGASLILTAHHADDQAETVLFRIARGTGLAGLAGIPAWTPAGLLRPLLPFWREELTDYARQHRIRWREDPSNATHGAARNRIRLSILPQLERDVSPAARRNLVALADRARESERAWRGIVNAAYGRLVRPHRGGLLISRQAIRQEDRELASRVLRKALRHFGVVLDRGGTGSTLTFISEAQSGREIQLPGGVRLAIEFDQARLYRATARDQADELEIPLPKAGTTVERRASLGGRDYQVLASIASGAGDVPVMRGRWNVRLPLDPARFPLCVRGRAAGDRIRTTGGTKSLKKLMIEARVPRSERDGRPIVVDSTGQVLWVPGIATANLVNDSGLPLFDLSLDDGRA